MCLPWCRPRRQDFGGRSRKDNLESSAPAPAAHDRPWPGSQPGHDGAVVSHKAPPAPPHLQPPAVDDARKDHAAARPAAHDRPWPGSQLGHDGAGVGNKAPPTLPRPYQFQPPAAAGHGYAQDKVDEETTLKQQQLQLPALHNNKASGAAPDDHTEKNPMDFNHH